MFSAIVMGLDFPPLLCYILNDTVENTMRLSHAQGLAHCAKEARMAVTWLKGALQRAGRTQRELARALDLDPAAVSRIIKGERRLLADELTRILDFLGPEAAAAAGAPALEPARGSGAAAWYEARGSEVRGPAPARQDFAALPKDVPVLGSTVGGATGDFEMNGETVDWVRRPPGIANTRGAFALYVQGESMVPWRKPGDLVYVNPARPARPGDHVVIELKAAGGDPRPAFVKLYLRHTGKAMILAQYNPRADDLAIPADRIERILRIMEWDELLGL
jgi:phage repressor protein C with HTH and peptisase S24 domain